jgi:trehalose synthase
MRRLVEVPVTARSLGRLEPDPDAPSRSRLSEVLAQLRAQRRGRVLWNVSVTSAGGGGAELLRFFVAYSRGAGINARWMTIQGSPEFYRLTKALHRALHGESEGSPPLDAQARALYEEVLQENGLELVSLVKHDDVVILHDSQTAGLVPHALEAGAPGSSRRRPDPGLLPLRARDVVT